MPRLLLILAVIVVPVVISAKFAAHHDHESVFHLLFMHLMPAELVTHADDHGEGDHAGEAHAGEAHADYLFAVPLPGFLSAFAMNTGEHAAAGADWHPKLVLTNLQLFQLAAIFLIFVCFAGVPRYLRTGRGDKITRLFAGFATWIRDEMVFPHMGKELGNKFLPFFLAMFFFIAFMNLLGLVPGAATATASVFVTAGMALITFTSMLVCGMVVQGPVAYWKNLIPHGVPLPLIVLLFPIEVIGLLVKPFALMVRLFANMTGGHLVVLSMMGLIFYFGARGAAPLVGYGTAPPILALAVFIMIIESFVALIQAYIFTQLSIIFVNASVHPEH